MPTINQQSDPVKQPDHLHHHESQPTPFTPPTEKPPTTIAKADGGKESSRSDSVSSGSDTKRLSFLIAKDGEARDLIEHERSKKIDLQKYGKKLGDIRGWWGSLSGEDENVG